MMIKNLDFQNSGFTIEQRKWIKDFATRLGEQSLLMDLPPEILADCWKLLEIAVGAAQKQGSAGLAMWEFNGSAPLFVHEVIEEISRTIHDAEFKSEIAPAILLIPVHQILGNIQKVVLNRPWSADFREILLSAFYVGMDLYAERANRPVDQKSNADTSTSWRNHGDGSLRSNYGPPENQIDAEIWLSPSKALVRLVVAQGGEHLLGAECSDLLSAMERSDAFAHDALYGTAPTHVLSKERHWSIGLNLYVLSDGRFWLDDVGNDIQGFVTSEQAELLLQRTRQNLDYRPETFRYLLAEYGSNNGRSIDELTKPYEHRGNLWEAPGIAFRLPYLASELRP